MIRRKSESSENNGVPSTVIFNLHVFFFSLDEFKKKKKKKAEKYKERKLGQNLSLMKFGEFVLIVAGNEGWKF